jgi:hypothetical protein
VVGSGFAQTTTCAITKPKMQTRIKGQQTLEDSITLHLQKEKGERIHDYHQKILE